MVDPRRSTSSFLTRRAHNSMLPSGWGTVNCTLVPLTLYLISFINIVFKTTFPLGSARRRTRERDVSRFFKILTNPTPWLSQPSLGLSFNPRARVSIRTSSSSSPAPPRARSTWGRASAASPSADSFDAESEVAPGVEVPLGVAEFVAELAAEENTDDVCCEGAPNVNPSVGLEGPDEEGGGAPNRVENGFGASEAGVALSESGLDADAESAANLIGESFFHVWSLAGLIGLWLAPKIDPVLAGAGAPNKPPPVALVDELNILGAAAPVVEEAGAKILGVVEPEDAGFGVLNKPANGFFGVLDSLTPSGLFDCTRSNKLPPDEAGVAGTVSDPLVDSASGAA